MKKGFTLIELLGVIIILGVIGLTTYSAIDRNIKEGRVKTCKAQEKNIIEAAKTYLVDNKISEQGKITIYVLKTNGYIDEDMKNPMTDELYKDNTYVTAVGGNRTITYIDEKDCNGQSTPAPTTFTGAIYRWSTKNLANYGTLDSQQYPHKINNLNKGTDYITEDDYPIYTQRTKVLNHDYYIKHDVENDEIINSYICFISDTEHCIKGMVNNIYSSNSQIIKDYQSYYNLNEISSPSTTRPGCTYNTSTSSCYGGGLSYIAVFSSGGAYMSGAAGQSCTLSYNGVSYCSQS